ncbi:MAG: acetate--CoA ligase family protein [Betaproteobacteria bacterium]|nr:acetate--CoA ligase family protein [Betaproteobacteria bacterium]MBI2509358.1 acetate--CoA ligase family protein [Betaproteobacteria bacterium]
MNGITATHDLRKFLAPSSVALVGATEELSRFGGRCLQRMMDFGYQGRIFPVNPKFRELRGLPCYPSVRDLPEAPDHVGIVVPAGRVLGILEDCAARGARFATVYAGGFAESGTPEGRALQGEIAAFARSAGMRVMGPNCNGLINFVDGFAMTTTATIAGPRRPAGNVAIVSQSGGVGQVNVMWRAQELGIGVSYEVSCGNSADLDVIDFARFMVEDASTDVILMVAERIGDGDRLLAVARRAAEREKPIVILKLGRTEAGGRAAASHTGAVTGSDIVHDAAFRQCGIIRVEDCNELYETAMLLRARRWPRGTRAAGTTVSGGNSVLLVDLGASLGISWPEYSPDTQARLAELLPKLGTTSNPTDVTNMAIGKPDVFRRCIETIAADEHVDVTIPVFTMAAANDVRQAVQAARATTKPVAILWVGGCNNDPAFTPQTVAAEGVPVYRNTLGCLKAVRAAMRYGEFLSSRRREGTTARPAGSDVDAARGKMRLSRGALTERASKEVLAAYGFPVGREALARDAREAVRVAREIGGEVAMKIESADILHKTEAGAIRLRVGGDEAVGRAFDEIVAAARRYKPDAKLGGVLVQEMAPAGLEIMLGLVADPVFGPVVVVGLGGIHVEVLRDLAYRVAPIDAGEARAMLRELRGYKLLEGVRGGAPRDVDALCDLMVRLSWLGKDLRNEIKEIDINPLVLLERGAGARVVDALVVAGGGGAP